MARSLRKSFGSHPQRRKTSWNGGPGSGVDGALQTTGASGAVLWTTGAQVLAEGSTLIRTRGTGMLRLSSADAGSSGFHGAFGIGIANLNAFNAGIASLLTPLADEGWEGWLYHSYFALFGGAPIAAAAAQDDDQVNATSAAVRFDIDSKAMRKLDLDDVIYGVMDVVEVGTSVMGFAVNTRMLLKLP